MKKQSLLIEMPWETRNLGVSSYMISETFFNKPNPNLLGDEINTLKRTHENLFVFSRIAKYNLCFANILERYGFYVVECMVSPFTNLRKNEFLSGFEKNSSAFIPKKYMDTDLKFISLDRSRGLPEIDLKMIAETSFSDDRFHLDYNCPPHIADKRFSYWVEDLISDKNVVFDVLFVDGVITSFIARKTNNLILTVFKKEVRQSGLAKFFWLSTCRVLKFEGHQTVETLISANNLPALNLYARLGFKFKDPQYSFHYWHKKVMNSEPLY